MKNSYVYFDSVSKEILDSVEVGDYILCNSWSKPMIVIAKNNDYFIMVQKHFKTYIYSICEKLPAKFTHNYKYEGTFSIGSDNYYGYYDYTNLKECKEALIRLSDGYTYTPICEKSEHPNYYDWEKTANPITLEKGHLEHSRYAITLNRIAIKKSKWNKDNIQEYLNKYYSK